MRGNADGLSRRNPKANAMNPIFKVTGPLDVEKDKAIYVQRQELQGHPGARSGVLT